MEGIKKHAKLIFGGIGAIISILLLTRVITAMVASILLMTLFLLPLILIPQAMESVVEKITSTKAGDIIFRAIVLTFLGAIVLFWISDCLGYV